MKRLALLLALALSIAAPSFVLAQSRVETTNVVASGTIGAVNEVVAVALQGRGGAGAHITGNMSGILIAELSMDGGTTWQATALQSSPGNSTRTSVTWPGFSQTQRFGISMVAGSTHARIRCSTYTSGSVTVIATATVAAGQLPLMLDDEVGAPSGMAGLPMFGFSTSDQVGSEELGALRMNLSRELYVVPSPIATANATGSCVTVDGTNDTILASFATRRGASIVNNGSVTFYMKLGATATTSSFPMAPGASFNLTGSTVYTGVIDGITASGSTSVCVVEW